LAGADGDFAGADDGGLAGADVDFAGADELISNTKILKEILPCFGTAFQEIRVFQFPTVLLLRPYLSREYIMNESANESVLPQQQERSFRKLVAIFVSAVLKISQLLTKINSFLLG
jgi:hypothetical protein